MFARLLIVAALGLFACAAARASDIETVQRYLARLGLVDLQILQLEQALESPLPANEKLALARRLADLYASRLMEVAEEPQKYDDLIARVARLRQQFPEANTTSLEVMLLQADYNRAETLIGKWIADAGETGSRDDAQTILTRIAPRLLEYQRQLNAEADKELAKLDEMAEGDARAELEKELARLQAVAGRATYFAGWASYYLGLVRENQVEAKADFAKAREAFRKVLTLADDDTDYTKVEQDWLSLEIIWRARAVVGLGLAEGSLGNVASSRAVFNWLESPAAAPQIRDQADYWYLQGLLHGGKLAEAQKFAAERIAKIGGTATQGKISFCVALVRAGYESPGNSPDAAPLGRLGIAGLAKLRQMGPLKLLIEKYKIPLEQDGSFFVTWLKGQELFDAAEQSKQPADFQSAAEVLQKALATPEAKAEVAAAAQCRYQLGWCRYRLNEFAQAARDFEQSATGLKAVDPDGAAQAAWMAFVAQRQLAKASPAAATAAIGLLETIKRDFPNSKYAKQADLQISQLRGSAETPQQIIARLKQIPPTNPSYASAQFDLAQLLHSHWAKVRSNDTQAKPAAAAVVSAVDSYLKVAAGDDVRRRLSATLRAADVALAAQPVDQKLAEKYLGLAEVAAGELAEDDAELAEFHFRSLQLARVKSDVAGRDAHARWLVENAAGSPFELSALLTTATLLEQQMQAATTEDKSRLAAEAYPLYARLVQLQGRSPEVLASQKNARVSLARLAQYAAAAGRQKEAAAALDQLLLAFPKDEDYLRRAGLAHFESGNWERALACWDPLVRGLSSGTPAWYEAKFHQLAALAKVEPGEATKAYKQLQLLHPELGGPQWRHKFEALAKSF